jgi:predicted enzyme related to lactoylglutathione lyase
MPEMSSYAPGTPCWVDVSSDDVAASAAFYCTLFGWESMEMPDAGGYTMLFQDGKTVAAVGVNQGGAPAAWSTYIATADADETAAKIEEAGGSLMVDVMDVMDAGRMAFGIDPQGVPFGVWQPGSHTGAQLVNEPGGYTWAELNTTDADGAQTFYSAVFGWEPEALGGGEGFHYTMQKVDGRVVGGIMAMEGMPPAWGTYFAVEDTDATVAKAEELGGSTVRPAGDTDFGRIALLTDPEGAAFAVIKLSSDATG